VIEDPRAFHITEQARSIGAIDVAPSAGCGESSARSSWSGAGAISDARDAGPDVAIDLSTRG
jgi:hypothetical protein